MDGGWQDIPAQQMVSLRCNGSDLFAVSDFPSVCASCVRPRAVRCSASDLGRNSGGTPPLRALVTQVRPTSPRRCCWGSPAPPPHLRLLFAWGVVDTTASMQSDGCRIGRPGEGHEGSTARGGRPQRARPQPRDWAWARALPLLLCQVKFPVGLWSRIRCSSAPVPPLCL